LEEIAKKKTNKPDNPLPLLDHLGELRRRMLYSIIAVVIGSFAAYPAVDLVIADLARPIVLTPHAQLIFTGPLEAFWSRIKLTMFIGVLISMPIVLFQVWSFIQQGLLPKEKRFVLSVTVVSFLLFILGASFCYFFILPVGIKFLLAYGSEVLVPMITISRYLSFVFGLVFSFGIIFELPLVVGFLAKLGLLRSRTLCQQWRIAVVAIFILAAVLTPGPDVFSQMLMAGPLLILYGMGILVAWLIERKK